MLQNNFLFFNLQIDLFNITILGQLRTSLLDEVPQTSRTK